MYILLSNISTSNFVYILLSDWEVCGWDIGEVTTDVEQGGGWPV